MSSITEQLFYGTIIPSEQDFPQQKAFQETMMQLQKEKSYFTSVLTTTQLEHLEQFESLWGEASVLESCTSFSSGFHLGISLMMEHFLRDRA